MIHLLNKMGGGEHFQLKRVCEGYFRRQENEKKVFVHPERGRTRPFYTLSMICPCFPKCA